jgi:hypothetical protein
VDKTCEGAGVTHTRLHWSSHEPSYRLLPPSLSGRLQTDHPVTHRDPHQSHRDPYKRQSHHTATSQISRGHGMIITKLVIFPPVTIGEKSRVTTCLISGD